MILQAFSCPVVYRPLRIYVGGQVRRPGYYTLTGTNQLSRISDSAEADKLKACTAAVTTRPGLNQVSWSISFSGSGLSTYGALPTLFDAIRIAQGITPF